MKKRLFTMLTVFAALALTACGGKKPCKTHSWDTWKEVTPSTCKVAGSEERVCKVCGQKQTRAKEKLEHTWDAGSATGNCGEAGKVTYTCTACQETKEETTGYIQHNWQVQGEPVPASDGGRSYSLVKCTKCQKDGLMVAVAGADVNFTSSDASKQQLKDAPEGCIKLPSNNDSFTIKINLAAAKTGKLYMRGTMDYWHDDDSNNENWEKGIYTGSNNSANFKMEVGTDAANLTQVTLTASTDLLYKDFFPKEPAYKNVAGTNWSAIGDVEIGNVSLAVGLNILKFTRLASYNIAIHDFVVAFDNVA